MYSFYYYCEIFPIHLFRIRFPNIPSKSNSSAKDLLLHCCTSPNPASASTSPLDQQLLLFLQLLHDTEWDLECIGNNIRRSEGQPLCQANVSNSIRAIYLYPNKILCLRRVLNVMSWGVSASSKWRQDGRGKPLLSGKTAVSPAVKSKVRALAPPMKTVARALPL